MVIRGRTVGERMKWESPKLRAEKVPLNVTCHNLFCAILGGGEDTLTLDHSQSSLPHTWPIQTERSRKCNFRDQTFAIAGTVGYIFATLHHSDDVYRSEGLYCAIRSEWSSVLQSWYNRVYNRGLLMWNLQDICKETSTLPSKDDKSQCRCGQNVNKTLHSPNCSNLDINTAIFLSLATFAFRIVYSNAENWRAVRNPSLSTRIFHNLCVHFINESILPFSASMRVLNNAQSTNRPRWWGLLQQPRTT